MKMSLMLAIVSRVEELEIIAKQKQARLNKVSARSCLALDAENVKSIQGRGNKLPKLESLSGSIRGPNVGRCPLASSTASRRLKLIIFCGRKYNYIWSLWSFGFDARSLEQSALFQEFCKTCIVHGHSSPTLKNPIS